MSETPGLNLLAVHVGNTHTRSGTFQDGQLVGTGTLAHGEEKAFEQEIEQAHEPLRRVEKAFVMLSSVRPDAETRIRSVLERVTGARVLRLEEDLPAPIGRQLDPESLIGEDRLLAATAAWDTLRQACVVIDAGTALTCDFVDGAGTFHGGAIAPGAQLMLDALHNHTGQLPEIELAVPEERVGHNTAQAMRCGVFFGLRGLVRELTERYAELAGAYPLVVATGGNADFLFRGEPLVERIVPDLTLMGMAVTLRRHQEAASEG
jgi:type III pantothenate kinase